MATTVIYGSRRHLSAFRDRVAPVVPAVGHHARRRARGRRRSTAAWRSPTSTSPRSPSWRRPHQGELDSSSPTGSRSTTCRCSTPSTRTRPSDLRRRRSAGAGLRAEMIDEVLAMRLLRLDSRVAVAELLTRIARSPADRLAHLYGARPWDGSSEPPAFPAGERPGLLTRALSWPGSANTRPIMKGVLIRRGCSATTLPPPPPGVNAMPPPSARTTTRETSSRSPSRAGSICIGCHGDAINPLGFATEGFDAPRPDPHRAAAVRRDGNEIGTSRWTRRRAAGELTTSPRISCAVRADAPDGGQQQGRGMRVSPLFRFTYARWED